MDPINTRRPAERTANPRAGMLLRLSLALPIFLAVDSVLRAEEPSRVGQELLRLVPSRACVVLTLDDLRGRVRDITASRLLKDILDLPSVKSWFEGDKHREFQEARDKLEDVFQTSFPEIRDRIFGDAVVLAIELPPEAVADPSRARGLLLLRASDPALLRKLVDTVNAIQRANGEVADVEERTRHGQAYHVRKLVAGPVRRADAYVTFPDGIFAISNSAEAIEQVIDGKSARADEPESVASRFVSVQQRLPKRTLARLFVDTAEISRLLKQVRTPRTPGQVLVEQHLAGMKSAGAALVVDEGRIALEIAEVYDTPGHGHPVADRAGPGNGGKAPRAGGLPDQALAAAKLRLDFPAIYRMVIGLVPERDRPRLTAMETVLRGILLGQELQTRVLPRLGPGVLAFADVIPNWKPKSGQGGADAGLAEWPFQLTLVVELNDTEAGRTGANPADPPEVPITAAIENALGTLLGVMALDEQHRDTPARIMSAQANGLTVKHLDRGPAFAFAVDPGCRRVILGTSPAAVSQRAAADVGGQARQGINRLRELAFPRAQSFVCIDLSRLRLFFLNHRDAVVEMIASQEHRDRDQVARDLEGAAALARIFEAVFWSHRFDQGSATSFHTFGLLAGPGVRHTATPER